MGESKKGMSACQIKRMLGVGYPTAWYMMHRIRNAMKTDVADKLMGILEIDEAYISPKSHKAGRPGKHSPKVPVMGFLQRGGKIVAQHTPDVTSRTIKAFVDKWAIDVSVIHTDEFLPYKALDATYAHRRVNHKLMYSDGDIHVNGVENFWSLLKRGLIGGFHKVSVKHLHRYFDEFVYRFNERENDCLLTLILGNCQQRHITFAELTT